MVDLLGPGASGASPVLTTTTDVAEPYAGDTWIKDCTDGASGDGTPLNHLFLNRLLQQLRVALRYSGVPLDNSFHKMLTWAIQSGLTNWVDFAGSANALTCGGANGPNNAPTAVTKGTIIRGYIHTPDNTGPMTFDYGGITPGAQVLRIDGSACTGGESTLGGRLALMWDGASWTILNALPSSWLNSFVNARVPPATPPFAYGNVGSTYLGWTDRFSVEHGPAEASLAGVWTRYSTIPFAYSSGGVFQGTINYYVRVS